MGVLYNALSARLQKTQSNKDGGRFGVKDLDLDIDAFNDLYLYIF